MTKYNQQRAIIKSKVGIRECVETYAPRRITNNRCACPIHNGDNDNFVLHPETQTYFCFVCESHGDVIKFVSDLMDISPSDAMKKIDEDFNCGAFRELTNKEKLNLKRRWDAQQIKIDRYEKKKADLYNRWHEANKMYNLACDMFDEARYQVSHWLEYRIPWLKEMYGADKPDEFYMTEECDEQVAYWTQRRTHSEYMKYAALDAISQIETEIAIFEGRLGVE